MSERQDFIRSLETFLGDGSKVGLHKVASNTFDMTAISSRFEKLNTQERKDIIRQWVSTLERNIHAEFLSLYTPQEAAVLDVTIREETAVGTPSTWFELINWGNRDITVNKPPHKTRVVAFYSFKGGVGRTTALIHVAWSLASRGKKVVMVDLDFEAPSLHQAVKDKKTAPQSGLVDYLYERVNLFDDEEPSIDISATIGEISTPKGRLFFIPAGSVTEDYIAKVDDLRNLPIYDDTLWNNFVDETIEQVQPDIILIDSRTGINIWGALSMLHIADDSIVFMNPTPQNTEGVKAIVDSLEKVGKSPHIVLSPVITVGKEQALAEWKKVISSGDKTNPAETGEQQEEPIMIPYASEIALSGTYPYRPFLSLYDEITNLLDDESDEKKLIHVLSGQERWSVIDSLTFSSVDAKQEEASNVKQLFQKTADFDRFLDHTTVLVKGKKGTGKTQLYWTMLKHTELVKELAPERLDHILPISGHGPYNHSPQKEDFQHIYNELNRLDATWENYWKAYALYRLVTSTKLVIPSGKLFQELRDVFKGKPSSSEKWTREHTNFLLTLCSKSELHLLVRDALDELSQKLEAKEQTVWLLYDDLDEDITEYSNIQQQAISGLFTFALSLDSLSRRTIRAKVFLRTDIWHRLNFTNKSHLTGRDVELKWGREDFLRLAFRQARRSSLFDELVAKFSPVSDINHVSEDTLEKALELLWGINKGGKKTKKVSKWVYERLTDANGSTFPRALISLLEGTKEKELTYQQMSHIQAPRDRLLRSESLNAGLIKASEARCAELRQEHKNLDDLGFFNSLSGLNQITELEPLQEWWSTHATDPFSTFAEFTDHIKSIGLASEYSDKRWKFADLYVHGFNISRIGRL